MEAIFTVPPVVDLPVDFRLSFRPFVAFLKAQQQKFSSATELSRLYTYLIDRFMAADALTDSPELRLSEAQLTELFQLVSMAMLPLSQTRPIPFAFGLPLPLTFFYYSSAFEALIRQVPEFLHKAPDQIQWEKKKFYLYQLILDRCYGIKTNEACGPTMHFEKEQDGLMRYYQMEVDASFFEPRVEGELPPLQSAWVDFANGLGPLPQGNDALPLDRFTFEGFSFFRIEDITETETIRQLEDVFVHLQSDTEPVIYRRFETAMRNLCGRPDLQISLMPLPQINGHFVHHPEGKQRSIFMRNAVNPMDEFNDPDTQVLAAKLMKNPVPYVFAGLQGLPEAKTKALTEQNIRSLLVYPIVMANEELGILEMASSQPDAFDDKVLKIIERIKPLVQELLRYQLNQFKAEIEQLVRTKFTSLQPAVAWRFYKEAWEELRRSRSGDSTEQLSPVRFEQVYPLYGAIDIRNSSVERHKSVRQDLADQLLAVEAIFMHAHFPPQQERPEQLRLENYACQKRLQEGMAAEDEQEIGLFLVNTINPYLRQLMQEHHPLLPELEAYFAQIDPMTGLFNRALKRYELTMDKLNTTVNDYINQEEKQLQTIYPHYFERYRTDGTEYTIYIGQSIAPDKPFARPIHRQLIEWQLSSMVKTARLTQKLIPELPLPLKTTQLILAHAHPVDIGFRQDERRFDVEGSYSIRYEVVKKRIDKALVEGTGQRLTQPDTIALVYSHISEIGDYIAQIERLQVSGDLKPEIEFLNLQPLQGVFNLKALRVGINYKA
ncbi:GAF domain-containing protein [Spirosoma aerolatum]|uniref:GAF domain-containing protein n=1 Tax=Spirosoma aerolatum TaxID=1211326 RepID=UPI0009AD868A|nr:GAF domain-containing protein [Spirosoma aerolatum]